MSVYVCVFVTWNTQNHDKENAEYSGEKKEYYRGKIYPTKGKIRN